MKALTLTFLLLSFTLSAKEKRATIQFIVKNCTSGETATYNDLKLYKNGKKVWQYDGYLAMGEVEIKDLDTGNYYVEYRTIFNNEERYNFHLTEYKKYDVTLCNMYLDYSKTKWEPFVGLLKIDESYNINFSTRGCFHGNEIGPVEINRKADGYYISYKGEEKLLTADDVVYLNHFEIELFALRNGGCTTRDTYTVTYNNTQITVVDGSCDWRGMRYLLKRFFPKTLEEE